MPTIVLDFDGVICDSARETAVSGWRAGRTIWPEWAEPDPPAEHVDRFVAVRPYLETGYQAPLMMKMVVDGCSEAVFRDRLEEICERLMVRYGLNRAGLVAAFGAVRDRWIASDPADWLARHSAFPGTVSALHDALEKHPVYISTTKQERFVLALLRAWGVEFPAERLFGLDRGKTKCQVLAELQADGGGESRPVHFVEDRLETLRRVQSTAGLEAVRLYYASWGYGTADHLAEARRNPRITVWDADEFLRFPGDGGGTQMGCGEPNGALDA